MTDNNFRGGDYNYPPSSTMYEKMSKENAEFQKGVPFEHCGKCSYYSDSTCKIVRGYISSEMVCKYFQEKYTPSDFSAIVVKRGRR